MPTTRNLLGALTLGLLLALPGCQPPGTYVLVEIDSAVRGVRKLELQLELSGQTTEAALGEPGGGDVVFPTSVTLQIDRGEGALHLAVIGRDKDGQEIARGAGAAEVQREQAAQVGVRLGRRYQLRITRTGTGTGGSGDGTVTATTQGGGAAALTCPGRCDGAFDEGQVVTLRAAPDRGDVFAAWSGGCAGKAPTCQVTLRADQAVTAAFARANHVFVTERDYLLVDLWGSTAGGNGGLALAGADAICNGQAQLQGALVRPGKYVAWLSAGGMDQDARKRVGALAGGWVRPDGAPFANTLDDLLVKSQVFYPPVLDPFGKDQGTGQVWSGTAANGTWADSCAGWTDKTGAAKARVGIRTGGSRAWTAEEDAGCDGRYRLYCLGVEHNAVVTPEPAGGRVLFISSGTFLPGGSGLAAADLRCQIDATDHKLPGKAYKALLGTMQVAAAARFQTWSMPVVRPDGVVVAGSDTELLQKGAILRAAPNVSADGAYVGPESVWTGGASPGEKGTLTCADWTNRSTTEKGQIGRPRRGDAKAFSDGDAACSSTQIRVYCLQDE